MQDFERTTTPLGRPFAASLESASRWEEETWIPRPEARHPAGQPLLPSSSRGVERRRTRKIDPTDEPQARHEGQRVVGTIEPEGLDRRSEEASGALTPAAARDIDAAAIVIALTAFFVTFLFGLVTQILPGQIPQLLLSVTCAITSGLLAREWMVTRHRSRSAKPPA